MVHSISQPPQEDPLYDPYLSVPANSEEGRCSLLAYYKRVVMAKRRPAAAAAPLPSVSLPGYTGVTTTQALNYAQKVEELKVQQSRLNQYLETLSAMLITRHQGKGAVFL